MFGISECLIPFYVVFGFLEIHVRTIFLNLIKL